MAPTSSKEFLGIQATIECGFTLNCVRDMIKTNIQKNSTLAENFGNCFFVMFDRNYKSFFYEKMTGY